MALTEKGMAALGQIQIYFPTEPFSASDLSAASGEKIYAATLNAVVNNGYLIKLGGSPVQYQAVPNLMELMASMEIATKNGCDNGNLRFAKAEKNDEFYTRYEDIEAEVMKYRKQFRGKVVYLPCDDPAEKKSEFWSFFVNNFDAFGLKKLIATHYDEYGKAYKIWIDADASGDGYIDDSDAMQEDLEGNGDFRSPECIEILKECDIVCTNPPFSLFREFVNLLVTHNKQYLIIGNKNAYTYRDIFRLLMNNQVWIGYGQPKDFRLEDGSTTSKVNGLCRWFTNMPCSRRFEDLVLTKKYADNPDAYPKYDNYDAIDVGRVVNIPNDYYEVMGVPVTFIDKYNPEQFEILGDSRYHDGSEVANDINFINGKGLYRRVLIRRKK